MFNRYTNSAKYLILIITLVLFSQQLKSQHDVTFYYMDFVPQSNYTNPALIPKPQHHLGLPGISHLNIKLSHDGFTFEDIIYKRPDDSLVITLDNMIDQLGDKNYITQENTVDLISISSNIYNIYFSFNITEKTFFEFCYPKDLITLVWKGNKEFMGNEADLSGLSIDFSHYREYGLSAAVPLKDNNLVIGGKIKLLFGKSNISTAKSDITLSIDSANIYALNAKADMLINASLKGINDSFEIDFEDNDPYEYFMNDENMGLAFDLGISYKLNNWNINASLIDVGYINWKSNTRSYYTNNADFLFEGVQFNDFFTQKDGHFELDSTDQFDNYVDSLTNTFKPQEKTGEYSSYLSSKIYLGTTYNFSCKSKIGILLHTDYFHQKFIRPSISLSYYRQFGKSLTLSTSYSYQNRSLMNLGFGLAAKLGFLQLYLVSDNLLSPLLYERAKNVSFIFGINLVFGVKSDCFKMKDKALIY